MNQKSTTDNWTIGELLKWTAKDFSARGIETARLDAEILLAHSIGCKRVELYMRFDQLPDQKAVAAFREAVKRRRSREPVAHIIGIKEFHDVTISVGPGQFVPRPETETLVDEALEKIRLMPGGKARVLDLCTGTGAIAVAILHCASGASAVAVDLDPRNGDTVTENARRAGVSERLSFFQGDLFEPVEGMGPFDLITCNPPYVPAGVIEGLMPEVKDHEPRAALDGGADGLDVVRRLTAGAPAHLAAGGWLLIEVGEGQAGPVSAMAGTGLEFEGSLKDFRGVQRVVVFRRSA